MPGGDRPSARGQSRLDAPWARAAFPVLRVARLARLRKVERPGWYATFASVTGPGARRGSGLRGAGGVV